MKSERRHDLQHNELLIRLTQAGEFIRPHANTILIGLILIAGAYGAMKIWSFRSGDRTARAWESFYAAVGSGDLTNLDGVSVDYSSHEVGDWAKVVGADRRFANGCDQLFSDKVMAGQELQKAMESYVTVLEVSKAPLLQERATFGLARTYEAMAGTRQSQGELKAAEEMYQELLEKWPDGVYAKSAQRRLDDLELTAIKEFYDRFAAHEPEPAFEPSSMGLGDVPFNAGSLSPGSAPREFSDLVDSPGLGGDDAAKDDSMETGDPQEGEATDSKKESQTSGGQAEPKPVKKDAE